MKDGFDDLAKMLRNLDAMDGKTIENATLKDVQSNFQKVSKTPEEAKTQERVDSMRRNQPVTEPDVEKVNDEAVEAWFDYWLSENI